MKRTAQAHWKGNIKEGKGTLSTQSGTLDKTKYTFNSRFKEGEIETNPEELVAAAHAGCFTMAVSSILSQRGLTPISLDTEATLTMEDLTIKTIHLSITGQVDGISGEEFEAITKDAEKTCLISKILNIPISSESHFIEKKEKVQ